MKIWSTKYACSSGIIEHEAEEVASNPNMVLAGNQYLHGEGREWHRSFWKARQRSIVVRDKKIASLRKQIERLEAMTFNEHTKEAKT